MEPEIARVIATFPRLKALVLGDCMLDAYLDGHSERLCREAPVPVVCLTSTEHAPGGAGNTAVNLRALGSQVTLLSVVGPDGDSELLRGALEGRGVASDHLLVHPSRRTIAKRRVSSSSQILLRFDEGTTADIDETAERVLICRLEEVYAHVDLVMISDYGYGVLTPGVVEALGRLFVRDPKVTVADSKHLSTYRRIGVTAVKPNYHEAVQLLGVSKQQDARARAEQIAEHGERILDLTGAQIAAVTLDAAGALVFERGRAPYRTYARPKPDSRASGAGDTFVSAFALALAAGAQTSTAAELASAAASIVVEREGTTACSRKELRECFSGRSKYERDVADLAPALERARRAGLRIVFTNGCFDILHGGHISYLNSAKALGDLLVVAVNSDESVRRLKGADRPINPLKDRIQVLDALSCVDHIVSFHEDTPSEVIRTIRPQVFVKGGDYARETIPEAPLVEQLGGRVEILPYVEDRSTSGIIDRIRGSRPEGLAARVLGDRPEGRPESG